MVPGNPASYQYSVCVEGHIGGDWIDWPVDVVDLHQTFDHDGQRAITRLDVSLPDQPALFGFLEKLRDLNLMLISIRRDESLVDLDYQGK